MSVSKQRGFRERNPEKPVLGLLGKRYSEWYLEFCPTGDTTRSELAEVTIVKKPVQRTV